MEVSIRENSMKTVCISIPRLIQQMNLHLFVVDFDVVLENIWNLCFWLGSVANYCSIILFGRGIVVQFSIVLFRLHDWIAQIMARRCFSSSCITKHRYSLEEWLKKCNITCLDCFEKIYSFFFCSLDFWYHIFLYFLWDINII